MIIAFLPFSAVWMPLVPSSHSLNRSYVTDITTPLGDHVEQTFTSTVLGVDVVFKQISALFMEIRMANHLGILLARRRRRKVVDSLCYHVPRASVQSVAGTSTAES